VHFFIHQPVEDTADIDFGGLQHELEQARKTIRDLQRAARKSQAQYDEICRAYTLTVANLVQTTSRCSALEQERLHWRHRGVEREATATFSTGTLTLNAAELAAIRKAMARIHHPDVGGDSERMKAWNTLLDRLEDEQL
jgi:hypothetical protein